MIDFFGPNRVHVPLLFLASRFRHRIVYGFSEARTAKLGSPAFFSLRPPCHTAMFFFSGSGCCLYAASALLFTTSSFCAHHLLTKIGLEALCTGSCSSLELVLDTPSRSWLLACLSTLRLSSAHEAEKRTRRCWRDWHRRRHFSRLSYHDSITLLIVAFRCSRL
jgi:hypothetical protein